MSRISEVLLGSVTPFELMMGKLLGNAGIAMLLAALYVGGGFAVAAYHGYADVVSPGLIAALVFFLILAILLYGSLYMAVGSACSELKDAQSLMMPVMLLSMFPMFVWTAVLKNPSSPLSVGHVALPAGQPVPDADADGPAAGPARLASRPLGRAHHADRAGQRLGGRQDLPHRPADAGQGPQLRRAGPVGDGEVNSGVSRDDARGRQGEDAGPTVESPLPNARVRGGSRRAVINSCGKFSRNRASRWKSEPVWMKRTTVTRVSGSTRVSNGT